MSSVSGVSSNSYTSYAAGSASKVSEAKSAEASASSSGAGSSTAKATSGVIYEPSEEGKQAAAKADRSALVAQLKEVNESRIKQMEDLVHKMISDQGKTLGQAESIWSFLAKGDFTVDAQTKAQAQKDIAEDGYWGVEQTSKRIFDFAMALTGGDAEKMEKMRGAFEKGFKEATKTWGKELPEISQKTYGAVQSLFDEYKNQMEQGVTV